MAPAKLSWTPATVRKLQSASSALSAGFGLLLLCSLLSLTQWSSFLPVGGVLLGIFGLIGSRRMHAALREVLGEASVPVTHIESIAPPEATDGSRPEFAAKPYYQAPAREAASVPQATAKTAKPAASSWTEGIDWEEWVGKKLLQKAGILIVLLGMLLFLKYSFDNRWIEELGRIALSTLAAAALLGAGEWFHAKYRAWAQAFTGGGIVLLFFTVWAARVLYAAPLAAKYGLVLSAPAATALFLLITVIGAAAAIRYRAQTIAWFSVLGGYLTPILLDAPPQHRASLVLYLALVTAGVLLLAWNQRWRYLNVAAFALTQLYLFGDVYPADFSFFSDAWQIGAAIGFFVLFNLLPLVHQFRGKNKAQPDDVFLIVMNGLAVFHPVVDALGGYGSGFTGFVCLALAAVYMAFSAAALKNRADDAALVNTYLVGAVVLVAGALLAELRAEWVAAGWAPLSVLLVAMSARLQRRGPWVCAYALLLGSFLFLAWNLPILQDSSETIWHPFTSNWALLSYVVFASVVGWILLARQLPEKLLPAQGRGTATNALHAALAVLLFLAVTFEATRLVWEFDLPVMYAYVALAVLCLGIFLWTLSTVWFIAAIVAQAVIVAATFGLGDASTMLVVTSPQAPIIPLLSPWAIVSLLSIVLTAAMVMILQRHTVVRAGVGLPAVARSAKVGSLRPLFIAAAVAQVWVHGTVEVTHFAQAYLWSSLTAARVLSGWWIVIALATLVAGIALKEKRLSFAGALLFAPPLLKDMVFVLDGGGGFYETVLWTALPLLLLVIGARSAQKNLLWAGIAFLGIAIATDMLAHASIAELGIVRSVWWALTALAVMTAGFVERERLLRRFAIAIFAATVAKLLIVDFGALAVPVRIGASIATGLLLIGASWLYQRFDAVPQTKR